MKRRDTLLHLKRFRIDEVKRRLGTLAEMRADLERKLMDLDESVARERQRTGDSDLGRLAFPSFLRSIDTRRENIRATMKDLEREHTAAEDDLASAFQDLKSFELAEEERVRRQTDNDAHATQSRLDELALVRHLRKHALRQI